MRRRVVLPLLVAAAFSVGVLATVAALRAAGGSVPLWIPATGSVLLASIGLYLLATHRSAGQARRAETQREAAATAALVADLSDRLQNRPGNRVTGTAEEPPAASGLRDVVESMPAAIAIFDTEMCYLAASRRYVADFRLRLEAPGALVGRSHYEVFPEVPDRWRAVHRRVLAGETLASDMDSFPRPDGQTDWLQWEMAPWRRPDGSIGGAVLVSAFVTARRQAEEALRVSEQRYRTALKGPPIIVFEQDLDLRYTWIDNPALGNRPEDLIGRTDADIFENAEDAAALTALKRRVIDSGEGLRQEVRVRHKGSDRFFELSVEPLRDAGGATTGVSCAAVDITERRRVEVALQTALESTTDSVMMFDRSWRITYLSERAKAHVAQGRDLVGQIVWDALPGTADSIFAAGYREAMESGVPTHTVGYSVAFQTWFEAHAYPSKDNLTVFFRDVTEARRIETVLRESETRLRVAVEAAGLGIFDVDMATGEVNWSAEQFALLGIVPTPDGRAHLDMWRDRVHPDDIAATDEARRRCIAEGVPYHAVYRIRRASDGAERWMEGYGRPNGPPGEATRVIGVMFDITERKRAEAILRDANAELECRVAERTRALTEAGRELQAEMRRREEAQASLLQSQKLEALGQLTGGVAHDFNNVLAAILGSFDLLSARITDERLRRFVDIGERAARRAESLVRQLLAFACREQLTPVTIEPASLLHENASLIRHAAGPRVFYALEVAPETWPIVADLHQLEVALLNLTVNARDAMADGGRLTITSRNVHAGESEADEPHPPGLKPGDYVVLGVHDTGAGMPAEVLARATEPFFTTKEAGRGTGLGLAMVHGFALQSGGALHIHSSPGEGTRVDIWLPRAVARMAQDEATEPAIDPRLHGDATLLVADDDDQVRPVTAGFLRELGYTVIEAANAEAAEVLAHAAGNVDLLVTDVVMPGADGPALAARLRADWPDLPVLFVTGHADRSRLEGESVLAKPFTSAELGRRVLECLGRGGGTPAETLLAARLRTPKLREAYQAWHRARKAGRLPSRAEFDLSALSASTDAFLVAVSATPAGPAFRYVSAGPALTSRLGQAVAGTLAAADDSLGSLEDGYRRCVRSGLPTYEYARYRIGDEAPVLFERLLLPLSDDGSTLTHLAGIALFVNILVDV